MRLIDGPRRAAPLSSRRLWFLSSFGMTLPLPDILNLSPFGVSLRMVSKFKRIRLSVCDSGEWRNTPERLALRFIFDLRTLIRSSVFFSSILRIPGLVGPLCRVRVARTTRTCERPRAVVTRACATVMGSSPGTISTPLATTDTSGANSRVHFSSTELPRRSSSSTRAYVPCQPPCR